MLRSGWVIEGSLPAKDGSAATARADCLLVLDSHGRTALDFGAAADGRDSTLSVADTVNSRITAIQNAVLRADSAGAGTMVSKNGARSGPLGLAIAPNGDVLTVNSGHGNIVETTRPISRARKALDTSGSPPDAGALFSELDLLH